MKTTTLLFLLGLFFVTGCSLGHKEVRYSEMVSPPKLSITTDGLLITISGSIENPTFTMYEIIPTVDEGDRVILLKGHEGMGRDPKNEFKVDLRNIKQDSIAAYKIFWVDPDNKRTELKIEKE